MSTVTIQGLWGRLLDWAVDRMAGGVSFPHDSGTSAPFVPVSTPVEPDRLPAGSGGVTTFDPDCVFWFDPGHTCRDETGDPIHVGARCAHSALMRRVWAFEDTHSSTFPRAIP